MWHATDMIEITNFRMTVYALFAQVFPNSGHGETCPILSIRVFPVSLFKEHLISWIKCVRAVKKIILKKQSKSLPGSRLGTTGLQYSEVLR